MYNQNIAGTTNPAQAPRVPDNPIEITVKIMDA